MRSSGVNMTCQHLLTFLLVMAASHLATPEGAAAATTAWETPSAPLHMQGAGGDGSHNPGGAEMHETDNNNNSNNNSNNIPREAQPGSPTARPQQQHQQQEQQQQSTSMSAHQEHPHSKNTSIGGVADGHDSSVVDTVLAALVDYSKDPKLWRFVHSVVEELDFSRQASHSPVPAAPRHPRPALHLPHPYTHWWGTIAGAKHGRGWRINHTHRWSIGSGSHDRKNASGHSNPTATNNNIAAALSTAAPQLPRIHQPPEEPSTSAEEINDNTSTAMPSITRPDRVSFVRSLPSPSPHFLFHRVFVNETFDSHTRQPYHRSVLALTAVGKDAAKSDKGNFTKLTNHKGNESSDGFGARVVTNKYYSLLENSVTPKYSSESRKGKGPSQDGDEKQSGGVSDSRDVLSSASHHHHHHHRLHTFKSQLKFLQRWEERLWLRAHFRLQRNAEGL